MRTKLWGGTGVLAAIAAGVCAANAADLSVPAYKAPVFKAPVIVSDWAGFYAGMAGGYGFAKTSYPANPQSDDTSPKGVLVGAYTGYNWQFGSWVTGIEVDFSAGDIKDVDANLTVQRIDELASARARLGYTLMPNLLVYGTGGGGYGHLRLETVPGLAIPAGLPNAGPFGNAHQDNFGWVAGGGLEYKLTSNLIARAEYLHYDLGLATFTFQNGISGQGSFTVDVVRGGLSYKF